MMSRNTLLALIVLIFGTILALQSFAESPATSIETPVMQVTEPTTTPSIERTPQPVDPVERLAFLKGKLKSDLSDIPLPDLMRNIVSQESFNLTNEEKNGDALFYMQQLHKLMSEDEWLQLLGRFQNNIFPLEDVIDSLHPDVQQTARDCGAEYVQVVMSDRVYPAKKTANVFCFYIVPSNSVIEQGVIHAFTPQGQYMHTRFWPGVFTATPTMDYPFEVIIFGMPTEEMGPYPFIWKGFDGRVVLKDRDAFFVEAADIFSTMSGTTVTSDMVQFMEWGPNEDFLFTVEVNNVWYYTEPVYNVYEHTFFGRFEDGACQDFKIFTPHADQWTITTACFSLGPIGNTSVGLRR